MTRSLSRLSVACALALSAGTLASAQGTMTASLSGVVVDSAGGVIPGATVTVTNDATRWAFTDVTDNNGAFTVPALNAGTYTVSVSLSGFKTAVISDVRIVPGAPAAVKATLEVGRLEETVVVRGASDLVNTQTATIQSTLNADQINQMPLPTRNAINAVTFLTGVNTATNNRNSNFNGLPDSFVAISLDGVNNNENYNSGDVRFPGAVNYSRNLSYRPLSSTTLRSTLTSNLVNELRGGIRWGPTYFGQNDSNGPQPFEDRLGFALNLTASDADNDGLNVPTGTRRTALVAQRVELEHRRHVELADGEAQRHPRHVVVLRERLAKGPTDGAGDYARRRFERSPVRHVQHDEFPGRLDGPARRRARARRALDGTRRVGHGAGWSRRALEQVRVFRQPELWSAAGSSTARGACRPGC